MEEIFKDIPNYEGMYQVSNLGRVKSFKKYINGKLLSVLIDLDGYYGYILYKNNKTKRFKSHQLVAIVFLGHKPNGMKLVVDHINNIKTDNRLENLQIITQRENVSKDVKNKTSKYTGVSWDKERNKWIVRFKINNKYLCLGRFIDELEASKAYQLKLKTL